MKLGVSYNVYDGEELLRFAAKSVRSEVDFICAVYQPVSYVGNPADPGLPALLDQLKSEGLIDDVITFKNDLSLVSYENEVNARNTGRLASVAQGCTHHITIDVDEFFHAHEVRYAKKVMEDGDFDCSIVGMETYYKRPEYMVIPSQNLLIPFIQKAEHPHLSHELKWPYKTDRTRCSSVYDKCRVFTTDEIKMHHMSHVRRDIDKKIRNSANGPFYDRKFEVDFDKYEVGQRVRLLPDFRNRKTVLVENIFGIKI